ncbi:hypothetical protein ACJMK2_018220 [Sinanodonta woodiana]|uniref:G-protein coupled receptors family 1 profile domain-containing protein n=1 Tax=Sinanodonta woodiana TaxID=1069815 RepID=A0ABD3UFT4_SINWO
MRKKSRSRMSCDRIVLTENMLSLEKSVAITMFLMIVSFLLSWTPYAIVCIVTSMINSQSIPTFGKTLPGIFAKCSAIWNPIVYVIRNREFRESLALTLFRMPWRTNVTTRLIVPNADTISSDSPLSRIHSSVETFHLNC